MLTHYWINPKRGFLCADPTLKKGSYRDTHLYDLLIYASAPRPPPPPRRDTGVYFQYSYLLTPGVDIQGPL